jgi:hypothetical protein
MRADRHAQAEQPLLQLLVVAERRHGAAVDDAPLVHHRDIVAHGERHAKILLHQQDRGLLLFHSQQRFDQLIDHRRRQTLGRLVHQQQPPRLDDGAPDRQHLLLPAGQRARRRLPFQFQRRKEREHAVEMVLGEPLRAGGDQHVLAHRQLAEDAHVLRHVGDPQARDRPSKVIAPACAFHSPMMVRSVVVLPAPLRPSSIVTPPRRTVRSTP